MIDCEATLKAANLKTVSDIPVVEVKLIIPLANNTGISDELAKMLNKTVEVEMYREEYEQQEIKKPDKDSKNQEKAQTETENQNQQLSIDEYNVVHTPGDDTGLENDNVIPFPETGESGEFGEENPYTPEEEAAMEKEAEETITEIAEENAKDELLDFLEEFGDEDRGFNDLDNPGKEEEDMLPVDGDENGEGSKEE